MSCQCKQCKKFAISLIKELRAFKTLTRLTEEKVCRERMTLDLTVFNCHVKLKHIAEKALCERMYNLSKDLICEECILKRFEYQEIEQKIIKKIPNFWCSSCANGKRLAKTVICRLKVFSVKNVVYMKTLRTLKL